MRSMTSTAPFGWTLTSTWASGKVYSRPSAGSAARSRAKKASAAHRRLIGSEIDHWRRVGFHFGLEEGTGPEAGSRRHQVGGDRLHGVVVRQNRVVVDLPGHGDPVLGLRQLLLQGGEVRGGPQLRVALGESEQLTEGGGEGVLRLGLRLRPLGGLGGIARLHHPFEGLLLVSGVALHGFHDIGDQVVTPLELHLDLRPRVVDSVPQLHQAVVEQHHQEQHDGHRHDDPDHQSPDSYSLPSGSVTGPGRRRRPQPSASTIAAPMSLGVGATTMPASRIAAIFASAVPLPPEMIAPAWPMRFPGGAVVPAMNPATGLVISLATNSAASSSAVPPISPIMMTPSVSGSSSNIRSTSTKFVPLTGSPPMPTAEVWPRPSFVS